LLIRYFLIGLVISVFAFVKAEHIQYGDKAIYAGLLSLIAVGLFGLIWRRQTGNRDLGLLIGVSIIIFLGVFFLSDNTLIGFEKVSAILLSFIAAGVWGLVGVESRKDD
jgi:nitrate reductase gamma subunit